MYVKRYLPAFKESLGNAILIIFHQLAQSLDMPSREIITNDDSYLILCIFEFIHYQLDVFLCVLVKIMQRKLKWTALITLY